MSINTLAAGTLAILAIFPLSSVASSDRSQSLQGVASYYGGKFHGRKTASGERFNKWAMTAAHKTLPLGTKVRVTNLRNGESVEVKINGVSILNINLSARDRGAGEGNLGTYLNGAPSAVTLQGWATTDTDGKEFISTRTDGWGHDALYDLGADPAFDNIAVSGSGNVTIEVISRLSNGAGGQEAGTDEQIVIGNFAASFNAVPSHQQRFLSDFSPVV